MKKILALILCLAMAMCLAACGGKDSKETTPESTPATQPQATAPQTTDPSEEVTEPVDQPCYKITVVDEAGNPFAGIVVQLCKDTCKPAVTDENGTATVPVDAYEDGYHANVTILPEGYEYASGEVDHYFESGATELTIVLKPIAE